MRYWKPLSVFALSLVLIVAATPQGMGADENSFITIQGSKLMVGNREFFVKGANYLGGRYISSYISDGVYEYVNPWQMYHNFNAEEIENEIRYLKTSLGINTIRLLTPCHDDWVNYQLFHAWPPWYLSDGSINPLYLDRLKTIFAIAKKYGIRIQLAIVWSIAWEIDVSGGGIPPGSQRELLYKNYITSLVPAFKNDPTLLSWEIGNETLLMIENYWAQTGREARMLSFTRRMHTHIRSLDPNHLAASGEVITPPDPPYTTAWHWPSAEFGMIPDIDNLNGGAPYNLASVVDYIAPHMYVNDAGMADRIAQALRNRTSKPLLFGESGYMESNPPCLSDQSVIAGPQLANIQGTIQAVTNNALSGSLHWAPFPAVTLIPGQFSVVPLPAGQGYPGECPYADVAGPPHRKLRGVFAATWQLFSLADLSPLPAAGAFKQAYANRMLNDSQIISMSVPTEVAKGVPFQVSVVMRNSGTTPWVNTGDHTTSHYLIEHAWAVEPRNIVWAISGGQLPFSPVEPGEEVSFSLTVTPPQTPGTYPFSMQMIQQGLEFFGSVTPAVQISVAQATASPSIFTVENTRVFPNPWRAARGDQHVTFDQMPANSTVKIFTVSGQWVKSLAAPAGSIDWDLTNDSGERVASGIYLYLVTDSQGSKIGGKFTVIR